MIVGSREGDGGGAVRGPPELNNCPGRKLERGKRPLKRNSETKSAGRVKSGVCQCAQAEGASRCGAQSPGRPACVWRGHARCSHDGLEGRWAGTRKQATKPCQRQKVKSPGGAASVAGCCYRFGASPGMGPADGDWSSRGRWGPGCALRRRHDAMPPGTKKKGSRATVPSPTVECCGNRVPLWEATGHRGPRQQTSRPGRSACKRASWRTWPSTPKLVQRSPRAHLARRRGSISLCEAPTPLAVTSRGQSCAVDAVRLLLPPSRPPAASFDWDRNGGRGNRRAGYLVFPLVSPPSPRPSAASGRTAAVAAGSAVAASGCALTPSMLRRCTLAPWGRPVMAHGGCAEPSAREGGRRCGVRVGNKTGEVTPHLPGSQAFAYSGLRPLRRGSCFKEPLGRPRQ